MTIPKEPIKILPPEKYKPDDIRYGYVRREGKFRPSIILGTVRSVCNVTFPTRKEAREYAKMEAIRIMMSRN